MQLIYTVRNDYNFNTQEEKFAMCTRLKTFCLIFLKLHWIVVTVHLFYSPKGDSSTLLEKSVWDLIYKSVKQICTTAT